MSHFVSGLQAFFIELKRRHVFRVAAAYVVGAFFVLEGASLVFQGVQVPDWVYPTLTLLALVGFPVVLVLAWLFEWTRAGIRLEPAVVVPVDSGLAPARGREGPRRPQTVRAYAFLGLGIVVALVAMGLSLPVMYAGLDGDAMLQAQRRGIVPVSNSSTRATLAVLPLVSLTGGNDEGFADGLAEDVTAALAQLGVVEVVSRTTSEVYRGSDKTARTIGAELGVALILEGTIRRAGNRVRVTAQLIDTETDRHLWASSYDRELTGDVFRTQSQLAGEIVAAIQSVVRPEEQEQAERRLLALDLSEQGTQLLRRAEPAYDDAAAELFSQAIAADPERPEAHAGLAQTLASRAPGEDDDDALVDSAAAHAHRAIRLNPDLPDGHAARGLVLLVRGELDSAHVALRRAAALDPTGARFTFEWQERVRMISPEALETARSALAESGRTPRVPQVGSSRVSP